MPKKADRFETLSVPGRLPPTGTRVLVTGATGFIGRHLVETLLSRGYRVSALARDEEKARALWPDNAVAIVPGDLARPDALKNACDGASLVFHLASCNHAVRDSAAAGGMHREVTVQGTHNLLAAAKEAGAAGLVFVSSVKAMGEGGGTCLNESSPAVPETAYGRAKLAAERAVVETGSAAAIHVCNLRLPMVYGLDNKGNLGRMARAIEHGWFPPLPTLGNRRSMVHVNDAIQAMLLSAENRRANRQTYIVTDGRVYSSSQIYELIRQALGRSAPKWRIPPPLLRAGAKAGDFAERAGGRPLPFNSASLHKLTGSAWYSSAKIQRELGYAPQYSLEAALPEIIRETRASAAPVAESPPG